MKITNTYKHLKRYGEIVSILFKYGLEEFVGQHPILEQLKISRIFKKESSPPNNRWERIRCAIEELGPTFVKLGQILSNRPDILPPELIVELLKLQDRVPSFDDEIALAIIQKEIDVENQIETIEKHAIASASIAQVYRAVLKNGKTVAIKVKRPHLNKIIETDLEIIIDLASFFQKRSSTLRDVNIAGIVEEFERCLKEETDFKLEARHIKKFAANFTDDDRIHVPELFEDLSTSKVLTLEFIFGEKVESVVGKRTHDQKKNIAKCGADLVLKQIFDHGYFHGDPHEGNIFILEDDRICFIDYGMMGLLTPTILKYAKEVIVGLISKNPRKIVQSIQKINQKGHIDNKDALQIKLELLFEGHFSGSLDEINVGRALRDFLQVLIDFKLQIPPVFYLLCKSLITIEGVARKIDPTFRLLDSLAPQVKKIIKEKYHPLQRAKDLSEFTNELVNFSMDLPYEIRDMMEQLKEGKIKIVFEHSGLEKVVESHHKISDRIVIAIILAALIIGSSLIVLAEVSPRFKLLDIPIIGIVGYLLATMLGFVLLLTIIFKRK